MEGLVKEIGVIFVFAGLFTLVFKMLRQPLIPAYVLAGIVIGPFCLNQVNHQEVVASLSEIAVLIMLFVIGIEMDITKLKRLGPVAILGGIAQVAGTFAFGFGSSLLCGLSSIGSTYIGIAVSFSSTMLVVKIFSEKKDMDTLYSRIVVGILIMQDILAIFALSMLANIESTSISGLLSTATLAAGLILILVFVCGHYAFPVLLSYVAREREVLFVVVMAIVFMGAFYAQNQKLSLGIGSFLVGLSMARSAYQFEIIGDLKALKSFFAVLFFTALGLQIAPESTYLNRWVGMTDLWKSIYDFRLLIVAILIITIIIKPILTAVIISFFGYKRSTSFNSGLSLGQISEFGLVIIAQGILQKHISLSILPIMIIVTVISMTVSSYLMNYNLTLYRHLSKYLSFLDRISGLRQKEDDLQADANHFDVVLIGWDRLGRIMQEAMSSANLHFVVVDSNPDVIRQLKARGVPCIFGDINSHEVLEQLHLEKINTIISTVPDMPDNELLFNYVRTQNPNAMIIGVIDSRQLARRLYELGADFVIVPYVLAGQHLIKDNGLCQLFGSREELKTKGKAHRESLLSEISH